MSVFLSFCPEVPVNCFYFSCPLAGIMVRCFTPLQNMPLIENSSDGKSDYYVILLSGNGGWRDLDKSLTAYLNSKNVSVIGLNTKQYLLSEKKPEQIAFDLETLMDRYEYQMETAIKLCL